MTRCPTCRGTGAVAMACAGPDGRVARWWLRCDDCAPSGGVGDMRDVWCGQKPARNAILLPDGRAGTSVGGCCAPGGTARHTASR